MRQQITISLGLLLIMSCSPLPEAPAASNTLPPDAVVTSPPEGTIPTNQSSLNLLAPKPGDGKLTRGNIFIEESDLMIRESFPPQISLAFSGNLPTPCYEIRVVISPPDPDDEIHMDIYSVVDPNMVCTQMLKPFQENIDLGTFASGHYTVWINGEMIGEFDS